MTGSSNNGRATAATVDADRLAVYSHQDLLAAVLKPPRSLLAGLIDERTGSILAGPPNVGKTWLHLDIARAIAAGAPWLDRFATTQANVLIFDEESHLPGVQSRARMLKNANPLGTDLPLFFAVGHGLRLDTQEGVGHLEGLIRRYNPGLVIADSFTRVHGVSENDAGDLASVFAVPKLMMRLFGTAFLFTDHVRKKSLLNDPEEMLRGSTEKRAWPDSILYASPGEDRHLQIGHVKSRWHERLPDFAVRLAVDAAEGTAALTYAGKVSASTVSKANDVITAIHDLKRQAGDDAADATTIAAWMDCHADTVRRHADKLVAAGILAQRKVAASDKGGKPKTAYDVVGGRE